MYGSSGGMKSLHVTLYHGLHGIKTSMCSYNKSVCSLFRCTFIRPPLKMIINKMEMVCWKNKLTNSLKEIIFFIFSRDMYFRSKQQISKRQIILKHKDGKLVYKSDELLLRMKMIPRFQNKRDPASINSPMHYRRV
jgi:hypothetical protein